MALTLVQNAYTRRLQFPAHTQLADLDRQIAKIIDNKTDILAIAGETIAFDMSRCRFLDLDVALRLLPLLAELKQAGNTIGLFLPYLKPHETAADNALWSFLLRWRFFEALRRHVDDPENLLPADQVEHMYERSRYAQATIRDESNRPTLSFTHRMMAIHSLMPDPDLRPADQVDAFLSEYRDLILFRALTTECGFDSDDAYQTLSFIAEEGVLNAVAHANGTFALVAMQLRERDTEYDRPVLILSVADDGIGIPEVLRRAKAENRLRLPSLPTRDRDLLFLYTTFELVQDSLLVAASMEEQTTSSPGRKGMGLYFLKTEVEKFGASLSIRSGHALVELSGGEWRTKRDGLPYCRGTTLKIVIPVQ